MTFGLIALVLAASPFDAAVLSAKELGADCKAATAEVGSLHAQVSFDTQMEKPKAKKKVHLSCGGKAVSVYLSEFAKPASTALACAMTGGQLWGGPGPTEEHSDELLFKGPVMVVVSGEAVGVVAKKYVAKGFTVYRAGDAAATDERDVLVRLAEAVDCKPSSKDPLRAWCAAAHTKGQGFTMPKGKTALLGITVALSKKKDVRKALLDAVNVSALLVNDGKLTVRDVTPENADEAKELAGVAMIVAAALKQGEVTPVKVSAGLAGFLPSLIPSAKTQVTDSAGKPATFTLRNPARAWTVTEGRLTVQVVVEDVGDGSWVNVYPAAPVTGP